MIAGSKEIHLSLGLQDDISRGGSETTVVVAAAVALILLIALVPSLLESVFELRLPATR